MISFTKKTAGVLARTFQGRRPKSKKSSPAIKTPRPYYVSACFEVTETLTGKQDFRIGFFAENETKYFRNFVNMKISIPGFSDKETEISLPGISEEEKEQIRKAYRRLLKACDFASRSELKQIKEGFRYALEAHGNTRRKSGELYIFHPFEVAMIVLEEMSLKDSVAVIAALLHDSVEDTFVTVKDIEERFGKEVANIVDGLTKLSGVFELGTSQQLENFRRLLLTISDDIRVVLIKIADRLHNMRTLGSMKRDKLLKIASETRNLYAPLAHRLGLYNIKQELDDLAMQYLEPEIYNEIKSKLEQERASYEKYIQEFTKPIEKELKRAGIKFQIVTRLKSISSIWRKMKERNIPLEEVYDIFAVRIILLNKFKNRPHEVETCWKVYSIITSIYPAHPERLRDWISRPKSTGYEALHVTVMGNEGRWVEIQIRTKRMHEAAEKGPVAHWKYKEGKYTIDEELENWINVIREALEDKSLTPYEIWERIRKEINVDNIYVFTPRGKLIILPKGSTVLDFAYKIHTEIGNKALAAKVNFVPKPLSTELKSGDQVEVITSSNNNIGVKPEWLEYVKTSRARRKIKEALREQKKRFIEKGREIFQRIVESIRKRENIHLSEKHPFIRELLAKMGLSDIEDLYLQLGNRSIDRKFIKRFFEEKQQVLESIKKERHLNPALSVDELLEKRYGIKSDELVVGDEDIQYVFGACCKPVFGDPIVAIHEPYKGISIHRPDCPEAQKLMTSFGYHMIKVRWNQNAAIEFLAEIKITGQDRVGMLRDIVQKITDEKKINIRSFTIDVHDDIFEGYVKVFIKNLEQLNQLMQSLKKIPGVYNVERVAKKEE